MFGDGELSQGEKKGAERIGQIRLVTGNPLCPDECEVGSRVLY